MMGPFKLNDVVVCVDARINPAHRTTGVKLNALYRVVRVTPPLYSHLYRSSHPGLVLASASPAGGGAFCAARFRKLDAADEQFAEQIRACKPAKVSA